MIVFTVSDLALITDALAAPDDGAKQAAALDAIAKVRGFDASPELLDEARGLALQVEDEEDRISFDDDASTSPSDEGTFVSCWFWVPKPEADEIDCGQCEGTGTIEGGLSGDGPDEECPVCDGSGTIENEDEE